MKKTKKASEAPHYTVTNCHFEAGMAKWDGDALKSVQTVAQALLNLTELFKAQGVTFESMLKLGPGLDPPKP